MEKQTVEVKLNSSMLLFMQCNKVRNANRSIKMDILLYFVY